jgi:hypothetical protein
MDRNAGLCVFCGRGPLTEEHIYRKKLRKLLPDQEPGTHRRQRAEDPGERSYHGKPIQETVTCVCGPNCNHGWMRKLEDDAYRHLKPLIQGHPGKLDLTNRTWITKWSFKTALIAGQQLTKTPRAEDYKAFYRDRLPPPGAGVWLGASKTALMYYRQTRAVTYDPKNLPEADGFMATMSLGHMVVHVVWLYSGDRATLQARGELKSALRRIWPTVGRVPWPPDFLLDEPTMDAICNSYGGDF